MTRIYLFQITPHTKRHRHMHLISRRTFLRFNFLNLVYAFTKIPLIHLKIITGKPLFIFVLLLHTNPHFLEFLKHRQFIPLHTTRKNILYIGITRGLMSQMMRHFHRHFITAVTNVLLGIHFDICYQTQMILIKVKAYFAWRLRLAKDKLF